MLENERDFRKVVAGLKIDTEPNPAHKERLRREMLRTFAEAGRTARSDAKRALPRRIRLVGAPVVKLAAAAAIVIAAIAGIRALTVPSDAIAAELAKTKQAMLSMPWMHVVFKEIKDGGEEASHRWYDLASDKLYLATAGGSVWCWDDGPAQEQFVYNPRVKTLSVNDLQKPGFYGSGSVFTMLDTVVTRRENEGAAVERYGDTFQGRKVRAYRATTVRPDDGMSIQRAGVTTVVAQIVETFMVDSKTRLMVAGRIEYLDEAGDVIAHKTLDIDYPQTGPRSVYDLGVPRSARVVDRRQGYIGTPGDAPMPVPTPGDAGRSGLVPLEIKLPKARFIGTPQNNRVPHLEKPRRGPRPPFLAPPGTTNVALDKSVWSSDRDPVIGSLELITDGDKEAADGHFVELGPFLQHVTIDLADRHEIYAIVVWHYHTQPRVYFDVIVQVSNDPAFKSGVKTVFNNDIDNSAGLGAGEALHYTETNEGKLIDAKSVQGRYVRLYSNGNTSDDVNHYTEVEVYGQPLR